MLAYKIGSYQSRGVSKKSLFESTFTFSVNVVSGITFIYVWSQNQFIRQYRFTFLFKNSLLFLDFKETYTLFLTQYGLGFTDLNPNLYPYYNLAHDIFQLKPFKDSFCLGHKAYNLSTSSDRTGVLFLALSLSVHHFATFIPGRVKLRIFNCVFYLTLRLVFPFMLQWRWISSPHSNLPLP